MDDKYNKRGFSGISDLTSDTLTIPQAHSRQTTPQSSRPQKSMFALLEPAKWPTLAAPWLSADACEIWVWGDFFLKFQKKPKTVLDLIMKIQGKKAEYQKMTYQFAMSVFYHIGRNPNDPSHRPSMIVALEQADIDMLAKMLGSETVEYLQSDAGSKIGPLMVGLFTGETHLNLDEYEGASSPQVVKKRFFEILGRRLEVSGQPKMI